MLVTARGALRFKHRAGLEKGLVAFDDNAYPEFYKSELWTLVGSFAFIDRQFEVEVDCKFSEAFVAMAREAVDGAIHLGESDREDTYHRIKKIGKPVNRWVASTANRGALSFGGECDELLAAWAPLVEKARADDGAKNAKDAKKLAKSAAKCAVVELPGNASHVVALPGGSFAASCGTKVVFFDAAGTIQGTTECCLEEYDMFGMGISGLVAIGDGRVVAFQELGHEVRVMRLGDGKAAAAGLPRGRTDCIKGGRQIGEKLALTSSRSVAIIELTTLTLEREIKPWEDEYVREVLPLGGHMLVSTSSESAVVDAAFNTVAVIKGGYPFPVPGGVLLRSDRTAILVDESGAERLRFEIGDVGSGMREMGDKPAMALIGGDVCVASRWPSAAARFDLATGERKWLTTKTHEVSPGGCIVAGAFVATWSPPPFIRGKETTIAVLDAASGNLVAKLDTKNPVADVIAHGNGCAALLDGRTAGSKITRWADLTNPRAETLAGHKGRVRGLLSLADGRLLSWAADKTARFWE